MPVRAANYKAISHLRLLDGYNYNIKFTMHLSFPFKLTCIIMFFFPKQFTALEMSFLIGICFKPSISNVQGLFILCSTCTAVFFVHPTKKILCTVRYSTATCQCLLNKNLQVALQIWIRRIRLFLGLLDPEPDP